MPTGVTQSGITLPTIKYVNSISEEFPNQNRNYKVESAISGRYLRDHIPINGNISTHAVTDTYAEFLIHSNGSELLNLGSFFLETHMRILKPNGKPIDDTCKVSIVDGLSHRILSRSSLFLNGVAVESNAYFGLYSAVKTYLTAAKSFIPVGGRNALYKDINTHIPPKTFNADHYDPSKISKDEDDLIKECRDSLNFITPLQLDISSSNFFLLNNVDIRLRFDLSPASVIINSIDNAAYKYSVDSMKLWCEKVVPYPSALVSLNKTLSPQNSIEYIFTRPIIKSFVFPAGHSSLSLDNIFNGLVPHALYIFFIPQANLYGEFDRNAAYFSNASLENVRLEINGNTISSITSKFPTNIAHIFHHTLSNLRSEHNLLNLKTFKDGRTIIAYDLRTSDCEDVIAIEKTGNVRLTVQSSPPIQENLIAFAVGDTTALVEVDGQRRVKTSYLM